MNMEKVIISKWYFAYNDDFHPYPAEKIRQNNYLYDDTSRELAIRVTR